MQFSSLDAFMDARDAIIAGGDGDTPAYLYDDGTVVVVPSGATNWDGSEAVYLGTAAHPNVAETEYEDEHGNVRVRRFVR